LKKVLIVGSGKWANTLLERYGTLKNLEVCQISFHQSLSLTKKDILQNDLCVLASRPQNNFELLLKNDYPEASFLVEKPLVYDEKSKSHFSLERPKARISVNYQYSSTSAWSQFIEICKEEVSIPISISISNLGPAKRDYISPALDYGSHVLALAIELRSILEISSHGFKITEHQGDDSRQTVGALLNEIELNLEFGLHGQRVNRIELRTEKRFMTFDLNTKNENLATEPTQVGAIEPILKRLENALNYSSKNYQHGIQESIEIFDIYQRVINS
jgi:hypothetical protein